MIQQLMNIKVFSIFELIGNFISNLVTFTDCSRETNNFNALGNIDDGASDLSNFDVIEPIPPPHAKSTLIRHYHKLSTKELINKQTDSDMPIRGPEF